MVASTGFLRGNDIFSNALDGKANPPRLYGRKWDKTAKRHLWANPWCVFCLRRGIRTLATVCDHIVPHRGDPKLFWDSQNNWQGLCASCHNSVKQRQEKSGKVSGCDKDGWPLDPNHHWRTDDKENKD